MKPASGNKNWLALLHRWISGDADSKDERALEVLAKDDPFLADAFEGYRSMPAENHAVAVSRIKADLRSRYQRKRRGAVFYVLRAAAVGAVLVAAWLLLQQFDQKENTQTGIAESSEKIAPQTPNTIPPVASDTVEADQMAAKTHNGDATPNTSLNEPAKAEDNKTALKSESKPAPAPVRPLTPAADQRQFGFEPPAQEQELATTDEVAPKVERDADTVEPVVETAPPVAMRRSDEAAKPATESFSDVAENNQERTRLIVGKVADQAGNPLIGASVLVEKTNLGAVTNIEGKYSLEVPKQAKTLIFSYTGFENKTVEIGESNMIDVRMVENSVALEEVAVSGLKKDKNKKVNSPEPKGGFENFEKYLAENLRYPATAATAGIEGEVVTSFRIKKDGSLYDFHTVKSLGHGCDEEAIRLLREGPKWKAQAETLTSYSIFFKKK